MNDEFIRNIISFKGEKGKEWLDSIPKTIEEYEEKWSIKVLPPFNLSYNYVAPVKRSDGSKAVIKICLPNFDEFETEVYALKIFNGDGIILLLDLDVQRKVMLLEKVEPGISLSTLDNDEEATRIIASVMKKLWKPISDVNNFQTLTGWFSGFKRLRDTYNGKTGPMPEKLVNKAEELFKYLIKTNTEQYLLHGDLHHDNVLSSTREPWLAIDPMGVMGERAFETAALLRNPQSKLLKFSNPKEVLLRRISILSEELGIDNERIRQWGIAQTVLSAIWKLEDHGSDWEYCIRVAEILDGLR